MTKGGRGGNCPPKFKQTSGENVGTAIRKQKLVRASDRDVRFQTFIPCGLLLDFELLFVSSWWRKSYLIFFGYKEILISDHTWGYRFQKLLEIYNSRGYQKVEMPRHLFNIHPKMWILVSDCFVSNDSTCSLTAGMPGIKTQKLHTCMYKHHL